MITQTIQAEEHIVHHYEKDWKMIKNRFYRMTYKPEEALEILEKQWNETYSTEIEKVIKEIVYEQLWTKWKAK